MIWHKKELGNLAEIGDGNHSSKYPNSSEFISEGVPFIRSVNLVNGNIGDSDMKFISPEKHIQLLKGHLKTGDILFTNRGQIGKMAIVPKKYNNSNLNSQTAWIRSSEEVFNKYLYYQLGSNLVLGKIIDNTNGTALQQLTIKELKKISIPLPPFQEQQKIAEILSTVDAKIEVIDQQIIVTQELKQGLMQRLLTKGIGHTEFKDSPVGEIPMSWDVVELEKLVNPKRPIRYGIVQTGEYIENGIPCIRVVDFNNREFNKRTMITTSSEISNSYKTTILEEGDIVFPLRGRIGEVKLVNENAVGANLTRGIALISNSKKINPSYLYWQIRSNSVKKLIELEINGTTLKEVPIGGLKKILIPISSSEEQCKISAILNSVEGKLSVLEDKKTHYQELKQGLMQQLLTGKIRVKI